MLHSASVPRILQIAEIQFLKETPNANVSQLFQVRKLMHQELHKSHYQGDSEDGDVLCGVFPTEIWQSNATDQTCKAILSGEMIYFRQNVDLKLWPAILTSGQI